MSFDEDVDRNVGREADRSRDVVRSADEQKRALSELNAIAKEHAQALELVNMNFQSLYSAMNIFASGLMAVVTTFMHSTNATKEQIEALDNLARQYLVMQQILKATNTSVEKYMKISMELQKTIKKQIDSLRDENKQFDTLMKGARAWSQIYSSLIKIVEAVTDVMYGYARQQLELYSAQIEVYRAQREYNQALAMYRMVVARYGKDSEQAKRALEALNYSQLKVSVANQQATISWWKLKAAGADTIGTISTGVLTLYGAVHAIGDVIKSSKLLSGIFRTLAGGLGSLIKGVGGLVGSFSGVIAVAGVAVAAFGAIGFAAEQLLGGYEGIKQRNKEIIESTSGVGRSVAEFGDQIVDYAQSLPPVLKQVVEGFGIVVVGWGKAIDIGVNVISQGIGWIQQRIAEGVTTFSQSIGGIHDAITKTVGGAVTVATTTFSTWFGYITKGVEVVMSLFTNFGNVINALVGVFTNFGNIVMGVLKPITDTIGGLTDAVKNIPVVGTLFGGGRGGGGDNLKNIIENIPVIGSVFSALFGGKQVGGEIEKGGLYYLHPGEMVTRRGFEGNRVTNVSPNINVNMTFNVSSEVDVSRVRDEVQRAVSEAIQKGLYVRGVLAGP
jgi:tetratricopeptide (TPR) repeat protein